MTTINNSDSGTFRLGDIVVGSSDPSKPVYSATGSKISDNGVSIYGQEGDLHRVQQQMVESLSRSGGKRVIPNVQSSGDKKKAAKKKQQASNKSGSLDFQPMYARNDFQEEAAPVKLRTIQFENAFGKMKAKVEYVVEHETAFMLVFSDADSMVFEPKTGESLAFYSIDNTRHDVYYPGVTFDSPDSGKKYMILFKLPEEN